MGQLGECQATGSVREVRVGEATFEQFLCPVPDSDLIRIYMLDITERKQHEVRLNRLNLLLLTIRSINEYLLVAENEEALYRFVCDALKGFEDVVGVIIGIKGRPCVEAAAWAGFSEEFISSQEIRWDESALGAASWASLRAKGSQLWLPI